MKPEFVRVEQAADPRAVPWVLFIGAVDVRSFYTKEFAEYMAARISAELDKEFTERARHVSAARRRRGPVYW